MSVAAEFKRLPVVPRCAAIGSILGGGVGAIIGLIVGLRAYVPTAAFAVLEVGFPGAIVGGLTGGFLGVLVVVWRKLAR